MRWHWRTGSVLLMQLDRGQPPKQQVGVLLAEQVAVQMKLQLWQVRYGSTRS